MSEPVVKYIVIVPRVVGGDRTPMTIVHGFDGSNFERRGDAISYGFEIVGSDDFNIGLVENGSLRSIWWMDELIDELEETIRKIVREIGLP
jgi:hypothetical protein